MTDQSHHIDKLFSDKFRGREVHGDKSGGWVDLKERLDREIPGNTAPKSHIRPGWYLGGLAVVAGLTVWFFAGSPETEKVTGNNITGTPFIRENTGGNKASGDDRRGGQTSMIEKGTDQKSDIIQANEEEKSPDAINSDRGAGIEDEQASSSENAVKETAYADGEESNENDLPAIAPFDNQPQSTVPAAANRDITDPTETMQIDDELPVIENQVTDQHLSGQQPVVLQTSGTIIKRSATEVTDLRVQSPVEKKKHARGEDESKNSSNAPVRFKMNGKLLLTGSAGYCPILSTNENLKGKAGFGARMLAGYTASIGNNWSVSAEAGYTRTGGHSLSYATGNSPVIQTTVTAIDKVEIPLILYRHFGSGQHYAGAGCQVSLLLNTVSERVSLASPGATPSDLGISRGYKESIEELSYGLVGLYEYRIVPYIGSGLIIHYGLRDETINSYYSLPQFDRTVTFQIFFRFLIGK